MVGSLWLFAASATVPSLPAWREDEQKKLPAPRLTQYQQTAALDHDPDYDADDASSTAATLVDGDEG
jgi:hypothetical protein